MSSDPTFDAFSQSITLIMQDGTPFNVTIPEVDDFILYSVQICINYAAQLGASVVLLVLLALLTKADKRTSPIFILNSISLAFNIIRNVLQCLYFTGQFNEFYTFFSGDFSTVPGSAFAISIAATVFTFLLLVTIEMSLLLQVHVVSATLRKVYRHIILAISIAIASLAIAFRLALCIMNARATLSLTYLLPLDWLFSATNVTTTISICWFCAVFVTKIGFALEQRHRLGLRSFGPLQILFMVGCQTLVIPVIFSILEYTTNLPSMDSNVLTLVSIFLPLSSMWAASSTGGSAQAPTPLGGQRKYLSTIRSSIASRFSEKKPLRTSLSPVKGSPRTSTSPLPTPALEVFRQVDLDLEKQGF
ncbi:hypothetical protein MMC13_001349 [Lambiella insularis]|nr:hypothetical protein [Lambiella insularis]